MPPLLLVVAFGSGDFGIGSQDDAAGVDFGAAFLVSAIADFTSFAACVWPFCFYSFVLCHGLFLLRSGYGRFHEKLGLPLLPLSSLSRAGIEEREYPYQLAEGQNLQHSSYGSSFGHDRTCDTVRRQLAT